MTPAEQLGRPDAVIRPRCDRPSDQRAPSNSTAESPGPASCAVWCVARRGRPLARHSGRWSSDARHPTATPDGARTTLGLALPLFAGGWLALLFGAWDYLPWLTSPAAIASLSVTPIAGLLQWRGAIRSRQIVFAVLLGGVGLRAESPYPLRSSCWRSGSGRANRYLIGADRQHDIVAGRGSA